MSELHKCYDCGEYKPFEDFHKNKSKKDGLDNRCKKCKNTYNYTDERSAIVKKHSLDNKEELVVSSVLRNHEQYMNNPLYRIKTDFSSYIRSAIKKKGYSNNAKISKFLGCKSDKFIHHIESLFQEGMSWDNHGEWEVDHIIPNSFAKTIEDIIILNHYTNLQPLWKKDNSRKGKKLPENIFGKFLELSFMVNDLEILVEIFEKKYLKRE